MSEEATAANDEDRAQRNRGRHVCLEVRYVDEGELIGKRIGMQTWTVKTEGNVFRFEDSNGSLTQPPALVSLVSPARVMAVVVELAPWSSKDAMNSLMESLEMQTS